MFTRVHAIVGEVKKGVGVMNDVIVCTGSEIDVSDVPNEIKIVPLGTVHSQKGTFMVDEESIELVREQFKARKLDLVVDYEHQTLSDGQAPAGGWIKEIYKGDDAIVAKVEWTKKAVEYLKNKEYRYLSPVVIVRKQDKKLMAIHSVALTNTPAIDGMFAIVNSIDINNYQTNEGGKNMDLKQVAKALGLSEEATEDEVKKALAEAAKAAEQVKELEAEKPKAEETPAGAEANEVAVVANSTVLGLLGLQEDAKTEEVAASIMALKAGGTDIQTEVLALKAQMQQQSADEAVKSALKAGKITAAQTEWATTYALKDADGFKNFVEQAPAVVPIGKIDTMESPATSVDIEAHALILKNCDIGQEDAKNYCTKGDE